MIITETLELNKEKNTLIVKLNSESNYTSKVDREKDEIRLGEIEVEVRKIINLKIKNIKNETSTIHKLEQLKIDDVKSARKLRKKKRDNYKDLAKASYNLYLELVEKKKIGSVLEEKLKSKNVDKYDLKKLISDVRRY